MNCTEFDRLLDAYLDRELSGSLRIEFDAHRLRCHRCAQRVAMMQSLESALASAGDAPPLAEDMTDRVMAAIAERPSRRRLLSTRVAVVGGMVLQAAAVLAFAILVQPRAAEEPLAGVRAVAGDSAALPKLVAEELDPVRVHDLVLDRVENRLHHMHRAGRSFTDDVLRLARYLNVTLPDDVAQTSLNVVRANPWSAWWPSEGASQPVQPADAGVGQEPILQASL